MVFVLSCWNRIVNVYALKWSQRGSASGQYPKLASKILCGIGGNSVKADVRVDNLMYFYSPDNLLLIYVSLGSQIHVQCTI